MLNDKMTCTLNDGRKIDFPVISVNTLIVGAGAAGLKCVDALTLRA